MNLEVEWRTDDKYRTMTAFRIYPQGPHSHIVLTGGGPQVFFSVEILAKRDIFESMKDAFRVAKKKNAGIF